MQSDGHELTTEELTAIVARASREQAGMLIGLLLAKLTAPVATAAPEPEDELLTAKQVARKLGVNPQFVYRHRRDLGAASLDHGTLRFSSRAVERFVVRSRRNAD